MLKFIVLLFSGVHRLKFNPTYKNTNTFHSSHKNYGFIGLLTVQKSKKKQVLKHQLFATYIFLYRQIPQKQTHISLISKILNNS